MVFGLRACLRMWKLSNKLSESQVEFTSTLCADPMTPPNGKCRRHLPLNVISFRRFFARWTSVSMVTTIVAFWRKNESSGFQKKPRPWMKSSCDLNCDSCVWCHFSILKKVRQKIKKGLTPAIFFLHELSSLVFSYIRVNKIVIFYKLFCGVFSRVKQVRKNPQFKFSSQNLSIECNFFK